MSIEKWDPFKEMESIRKDMDKIWDEIFPTPRRAVIGSPWRRLSAEEGVAIPPIDVIDKGKSVLVRMEMPGVSKDDIEIAVEDGCLKVKGELKHEEETKREDYYHSERSYQRFERSFKLPGKVDTDKITANLKDGILDINLPKIEEAKPKKIKVDIK